MPGYHDNPPTRYLRKALFPHHPDLKYAGLLNPLDCPHHMRREEKYPFREGVVLKRPTKKGKGSFVDCGIDKVRLRPNLEISRHFFVIVMWIFVLCILSNA